MVTMPESSLTVDTAQAIVDKLKEQVGKQLAVEFYPEKPANYRLNHANGALLVSYAKSSYPRHDDFGAIAKPRRMTFSVTIVSRHLYDRFGAVPLVDWVLAMLSGFTPPHADKPLAPTKDYFIRHEAGLWFYGVDFDTECVHVQTLQVDNEFL